MYLTHAVFVDAGYLLAASSQQVLGTAKISRSEYHVHYSGLVSYLKQQIAAHCDENSRLLRIYWYDGAQDGKHTPEHRLIAALPDIKVRLGRLMSGQQKGVDSLIVRDLMVLSLNRALQTAYLVGGDEDLREGVVSAQEAGVRVILVGVGTGHNQADTLVWEADDYLTLDSDGLKPFFRRVTPTYDYDTICEEFIGFWLGGEPPTAITRLVDNTGNVKSLIPHDIDRNLFNYAYKCLGAPVPEFDRSTLRSIFLGKVQRELAKQSAATGYDSHP